MSYLVFARKWRPQTFEDVVGQEHVTTTLKNAILLNRVAHAYLFSGPRGVGKTTTARIFAKALNCQGAEHPAPTPCNKCESCMEITEGRSLDVIEIDGASNRGIDEIRQLRENVKFGPSRGRYKVYIIDEVHQITQDGFNALLKTLEEPPPHVKFVFATTHRHKVIPTILSRCQRFDFRKVSTGKLVDKLKAIAQSEKVDIDVDALFVIARAADGSVRDAESILDQLVSFSRQRIHPNDVVSLLGSVEHELLFEVTQLIIDKDTAGALGLVNDFINEGKDPFQFVNGLLEHFRNLAIAKIQSSLIDLPSDVVDKILKQSLKLQLADILNLFGVLSNIQELMRRSGFAQIQLEMAMINLTKAGLVKDAASKPDAAVNAVSKQPAQSGVKPRVIAENMQRGAINDFGPSDIKYVSQPIGADGAATIVEDRPLVDNQAGIETEKKFPAYNNVAAITEDNFVTIDEIRNVWHSVLERIKSEKISAALFLLEGRPQQVEGAMLTVNFPQQFVFYKEALERIENRCIIEKYLKEVLGKFIRIKFAIVDTLPPEADKVANGASSGEAVGEAPKESPLTQKVNPGTNLRLPAEGGVSGNVQPSPDPIVKVALEIFKGRVLGPVRNLHPHNNPGISNKTRNK